MPAYNFKSMIYRYSSKGEKTGWFFVEIPKDIIPKLKLKNRKGFRIKGVIDDVKFEKLSTYPTGEGGYIIAINGEMRKKLGKKDGAMVSIKFELDSSKSLQSKELLACLKEDEIAMKAFKALLLSHQNYHHRYVETAKTSATKAERIVNVIHALYKKQDFGEMIRGLKKK
jgi:hypothetical protein